MLKTAAHDPIALTQRLIQAPSVTPHDAGAIDILIDLLKPLGFKCHDVSFEGDGGPKTRNLLAVYGDAGSGPNFAFAGHTDVVPPGKKNGETSGGEPTFDESAWSSPPFAAKIKKDILIGRGAVDMKGAIAAFVAATARILKDSADQIKGQITFLITGDEEGSAENGTAKLLKFMKDKGIKLDACLVGEPTNPETLGDMAKIGRRGSFSGNLTVIGKQGHVAYPDLAHNPIPLLMEILQSLKEPLDHGTEFFPPSNLEVTTIDVANPTVNIIPGSATAKFNIRFNTLHTHQSLFEWLSKKCDEKVKYYNEHHNKVKSHHYRWESTVTTTAQPFLTAPGPLSDITLAAIQEVTGKTATLSTTGGTSDARFIKDYCPVIEFGLINKTAHHVDESIGTADLETLTQIYEKIIEKIFQIERK